MITKNFEEYFPLPWTVLKTKNGAFVRQNAALITGKKSYKELVELGLIEEFSVNSFPPRVAALKYAVQCANLMPEAAALIKRWRDEKAKRREELCTSCANDEDGYMDSDECDMCLCKELDADIELADKLLAKLEGGAEDERD